MRTECPSGTWETEWAAREVYANGGAVIRIVAGPAALTVRTSPKWEEFRSVLKPDGIRVARYHAPGIMYGCLYLQGRVREGKRLPRRINSAAAAAMSLRGTRILLMKLELCECSSLRLSFRSSPTGAR